MGTIVVSVDAELGWGFHDEATPPTHRVERCRWGWRQLLALFDEFEVPATWAVVGHLLLEDCDGYHRDHPAGPSWFVRERTTWRSRPELRFAEGLVDRVRAGRPDHEIGCHTFSHVEFGDPRTSREVARAELERCQSVADDAGVEFRSFVYPKNEVGYRDLLAEYGFACYRGHQDLPPDPNPAKKLVAATLGTTDARLVTPTVDEHGLVNVPPSLFLFSYEGLARRLTGPLFGDPVVQEARRGVDAAIDQDGVYHLWLHPNNLTRRQDVERLRRILAYVDAHRHELSIATMGDVAERTLADRPRPLAE